MTKKVNVTPLKELDLSKASPIKIVGDVKENCNKISLATKVDRGFIMNLSNVIDDIGDFIDLEVDPSNCILTIHFKNKKAEESELAHEMR